MKEGKLKKIIKIDWTIFYSKPRIQILGILIFLDIMLLFTVKKEIEKGFNVSSVLTSIVLFILFILLNGLFIFYYKNKFPNIEFYDDYFTDIPANTRIIIKDNCLIKFLKERQL